MNLPICSRPLPEELWQGYIMRLASLNGYQSLKQFECTYLYGHDRMRHSGNGYPKSLTHVCERMKETVFFPSLKEAIEMTPYYAEVEGLPEGQQAKLAESILYDLREAVTPSYIKRGVYQFRVCPECMEEDFKEHGFRYLHLEHHLPGVCVCKKHNTPLIELEMFDKRISSTLDMERGQVIEVSDMADALEHAEKMKTAWHKNKDILESQTCPLCGQEYFVHPYSKRTAAGCPFCRHNEFAQAFMEYRLNLIYGNEYIFTEAFTSLRTKVLHLPCKAAKRTLDMLLYETKRECSGCKAISIPKIQKRINLKKKEFLIQKIFLNENGFQSMMVTHQMCGKTFNVNVLEFQNRPRCIFCDRMQKIIDIRDVHGEYEIISKYRNNHEAVTFRHKVCGCIFKTSKTSFLSGSRCPICTTHYDFKMVEAAVRECTDLYQVERGEKRGNINLFFLGEAVAIGIQYAEVMNDLMSDYPELVEYRNKKYIPPKSVRRIIYDSVLQGTKEKGFWQGADGIDGHHMSRLERNLLQDLTNQGYIERIEKGRYRIDTTYDTDCNQTRT